MTKKIIFLALCSLLLAPCFPAEAQQQAKIPKIGYLGVRPDDSSAGVEFLQREFRALGYVEGKTYNFEYRNAENKPDRLPALVNDLIRLKVDVLIVAAPSEARAAKNATKNIPIVGANLGDPVTSGWSKVSRVPAETLPDFRILEVWLANAWSYSRKRFPSSPALRCCGNNNQARRKDGTTIK